MSEDELVAIYKAKYASEKISWEQTRLICYYSMIALRGTKNYTKPEKLFTLLWDKKSRKKASGGGGQMTKEEIFAKAIAMRNYKDKKIGKKDR